ncbi:hypothetical protein F5Y19DRAFT_338613 [Xylariaceae sp. FL1651]|nr:hypothetical protein F5Y19DRAFT_338613 [Xylariaceae sp. FL1651]
MIIFAPRREQDTMYLPAQPTRLYCSISHETVHFCPCTLVLSGVSLEQISNLRNVSSSAISFSPAWTIGDDHRPLATTYIRQASPTPPIAFPLPVSLTIHQLNYNLRLPSLLKTFPNKFEPSKTLLPLPSLPTTPLACSACYTSDTQPLRRSIFTQSQSHPALRQISIIPSNWLTHETSRCPPSVRRSSRLARVPHPVGLYRLCPKVAKEQTW